jgi:GMP synthase-like glutamine amidotransferase
MHLHCFQHVSFENSGTILEWAALNHYTISYTCFFERNFSLPVVNELDVLLVMGGYMNVDEEQKFPWLVQEKEYIRQAIASGKKVIGICLGAQLIASALGNKVYPGNEKEIGFFPIQFTENALKNPLFNHFNNPYTVFHWHCDTFDLPENAQLIASTHICKHQAYLIGENVLGLQFHFEMNEAVIQDMLLHDGHELEEEGNYIQKPADIKVGFHYLQQNKKGLFVLLDKFLVA